VTSSLWGTQLTKQSQAGSNPSACRQLRIAVAARQALPVPFARRDRPKTPKPLNANLKGNTPGYVSVCHPLCVTVLVRRAHPVPPAAARAPRDVIVLLPSHIALKRSAPGGPGVRASRSWRMNTPLAVRTSISTLNYVWWTALGRPGGQNACHQRRISIAEKRARHMQSVQCGRPATGLVGLPPESQWQAS
jgi:hypothetical protein